MYTIKLPLHKEDIVLMLSVLGRKFETREQAEDYAKAMNIEHPVIRKVGVCTSSKEQKIK